MVNEEDLFKDPNFNTPQQIRLAQPNLQAFHSTGLISKKQRAQITNSAGGKLGAGGMVGNPPPSVTAQPHSANYQAQAHSSYPHLIKSGPSGTLHGLRPDSATLATPLFKKASTRPVDMMIGSAMSNQTSIDSSPSSHLSSHNRLNIMMGLADASANGLDDDFERGYRSPLSVKTDKHYDKVSLMASFDDSGVESDANEDEEVENVFMDSFKALRKPKHAPSGVTTPVAQRTYSIDSFFDPSETQMRSPTAKRRGESAALALNSSPVPKTTEPAAPLTPVSNIEMMKSRLYTLYPRFLTLDYIKKLRQTPSTSRSLALLTSPNSNVSMRIQCTSSAPCSEAGSSPTMAAALLNPKPLYPPTRHSDTDDYFETNFRIIERLGEGSFAEAFQVENLLDGRQYAIKRTRTAYAGYRDRLKKLEEVYQHFEMMQSNVELPPDFGSRFYRELIVPSNGPPPRLVRLVQSWEQHGILYMQLELCCRGSLQSFLERTCDIWETIDEVSSASPFLGQRMAIDSDDMLSSSTGLLSSSSMPCRDDDMAQLVELSEEQIWSMLVELTLGLKAIHVRGKLHLDLKPANIFITEDWHLKIGDFGLAGDIPLNRDAEKEGDRIYIAPEVLEGRYSPAADVFSLGLIILEMAANVVLPENGSAWHQIRSGELCKVSFPPHISDSMKYLIDMMLSPDPEQRITLDQIFELPPVQAILSNAVKLINFHD